MTPASPPPLADGLALSPTRRQRPKSGSNLDLQALRQKANNATASAMDHALFGSAWNPPTALALLDRLEAAETLLAAKEAAEGAAGWRSIESAPKDGTRVLGHQRGRLADDNRFTMEWRSTAEGERWMIVCNPFWLFEPTHWQPLPPPPALSSGGAG